MPPDNAPACDCHALEAHDERCALIRWLRSPAYEDDLIVPAFLARQRRQREKQGVFD